MGTAVWESLWKQTGLHQVWKVVSYPGLITSHIFYISPPLILFVVYQEFIKQVSQLNYIRFFFSWILAVPHLPKLITIKALLSVHFFLHCTGAAAAVYKWLKPPQHANILACIRFKSHHSISSRHLLQNRRWTISH